MIVPEFMRFYGYSVEQTLSEYAMSFFALVNSMYRLKADEQIANIQSAAAGYHDPQKGIDSLKKQSAGVSGILREVRNVKK